jgi:hypothetical protein
LGSIPLFCKPNEETMDESFKTALRAALHRWVDEALDSEHGDVDLSRQGRSSQEAIWTLQLRWTGAGDDLALSLATAENRAPHRSDE